MKNTKKSLIASGISLAVSVALLAGSTFAWFTDSVTNKGNKIQAGTLDVSLAVWDGAKGGYVEVGEAPIFNYDKWEPGYTDIAAVKIGNEGTLALKYKLDIIANGATDLAEVIDVYYYQDGVVTAENGLPKNFAELKENSYYKNIGTLDKVLAADTEGVANGHLKADEADFAIIALHMQETAGNEYQGTSIGGTFDIVLNATQYTYEPDSFGSDQYDKDAPLPEVIESTDYGSLQEAVNAADGDTVVVKENQSPASALNISKDITLNLGSSIINGDNNSGNGINISGDSKTVTIQATTGGVQLDNERCIRMSSNGSNITVDGGSYSLAGTHNAYLMEGSGDNNTVTIQNVTYNGERGFQLSNGDNNTILIKDSTFATTGYSAVYLGGNNNVLTLENVTITGGSRIMAADTFHSGDNAYATINITSGTYDCDLTTNDGCIISITGGRFSDDPTKYLAEGYKADYDRDARMWTVVAE